MNTRSLPLLAGALGVTLAFTTLTGAAELEQKQPQGEKIRRETEGPRRESEEPRDREPRRPEARGEGREEGGFRPRANEAEALRARLKELVSAGRKDEAEQVRQRLEEMESQAREPQRRPLPPDGGPEETERRMKHLAAAIENLHAAGNHELAEELQRQMAQGQRPMPEPRGSGQPGPRGPGRNQPGPEHAEPGQPGFGQPGPRPPGSGQPGPGQPGLDPRTEELHIKLRHLNSEVQELREQLQEMRRQLEPRKK